MSTAVILGLTSALLYGATDFVARFASQAAGVLRTMLYGQAALATMFGLYLLLNMPDLGSVPPSAWLALLSADAALLIATACLYRAVAVGPLGIISPIVACYGAVAAGISIATGERLPAAALAGLALTIAGAILAASRPKAAADRRPYDIGTKLAAASAALFGFGFWLQGRHAIPEIGAAVSVWSYYAAGTICISIVAYAMRIDARPLSRSEMPKVFGVAACASGGYLALAAGQEAGSVAIVTALSSLATLFTVLLARIFLGERLSPTGWTGLVCVTGGLVLLHLGEKIG